MLVRSSSGLLPAVLIGAAALWGGTYPAEGAEAQDKEFVVCYYDKYDQVGYKLGLRSHTSLRDEAEARNPNIPREVAFSVHGKKVGACAPDTVRPVVGTVISKLPLGALPGGARMGLLGLNTSSLPGGSICSVLEISCLSEGRGFPPKTWDCFSRNNEADIDYQFLLHLQEKGDPDGRCR